MNILKLAGAFVALLAATWGVALLLMHIATIVATASMPGVVYPAPVAAAPAAQAERTPVLTSDEPAAVSAILDALTRCTTTHQGDQQ